MKPNQVFSKTMPFIWMKLLLGLATVLISGVIFALFMGIALLTKSDSAAGIMIFIWLGATGLVNYVLNHYIGYLVKAGHVAVITEAVVTGRVPDNQVEYGKQMVKERFLTANVYFMIDKLVSGAVRQLQRVLEKAGGLLGFIPGMSTIVSIAKLFIGIALGYIDECCLGYTFLKKEQGAFKSAADGVVIYAQNWKKLLKDAAKTTVLVIILLVVSTIVSFALIGALFAALKWNGIAAFIISALVAWAIKSAFIDSFMMIKMMVSYMEEAPSTVITYDLYNKLCGWSVRFKELFSKGQSEGPVVQTGRGGAAFAGAGAGAAAGYTPAQTQFTDARAQPTYTQPNANANAGAAQEKPVFCGACGAQNKRGVKFCGSCGNPM